MFKTPLHPLRHCNPEFRDGSSCRALFRRRPLPHRHRAHAPTSGSRAPLARFATLLLATTVMLGALSLGRPEVASAADLSLGDLGARVCAPHGPACGELWNARLAAGDPLMTLVPAVCLYLRYEVHEVDGIICLETVIRAARFLPPDMFSDEDFASAVDTRNGSRLPMPDPQWNEAVASYLEGIPALCDRTTPVVYEYFDCLLRELQTVKFALRHRVLAACSIGVSRAPIAIAECRFSPTTRRASGHRWPAVARSASRT